MTTETEQLEAPEKKKGLRGIHILWIVLATILVTAAVTYWVVRTYIYAKDFTPVQLSQTEQQVLNKKLESLGYQPAPATDTNKQPAEKETDEAWLRAERYSEKNARREVFFTERELNGMVANNQEMAKKLAIDLSDDLVSARILVPVDPDFPILGGKTLRVSTGMELAFRDARPVVILKGVSIMGVPIPNAWLGGLKNIDLVSEFGDEQGFWAGFAEGVDNIRVVEGELKIKLKE
ncbi:MAG: arginine N-succinyltransferase [Candidatus Thiodiazotropha taylori]|nr:arginine N-succinyltransferase [Candidatus Thiodiazotropha taylori]MCG7973254.1 arginine N-succinyltransferase [Candidatus Thiodiazotropha taylori]MCG8040571.1 arginine N-succinyltransferase [Candidatus Thiodiazotropha taylori]MCW4320851.1 arginine N-succinyltransferase [Candidatus Thiodiazotropha taylori]